MPREFTPAIDCTNQARLPIAMQPVTSNQIRAVGYCHDTKTLAVSFTPAPAPAQEFNKSVADAEIKALYVESQGSDKGWLGIEGSYFISGVVAARMQKKATKPAQEVGLTDEDVNAAAKVLAERFDYPWERMPEEGRKNMRVQARAVVEAALRAKGGK